MEKPSHQVMEVWRWRHCSEFERPAFLELVRVTFPDMKTLKKTKTDNRPTVATKTPKPKVMFTTEGTPAVNLGEPL